LKAFPRTKIQSLVLLLEKINSNQKRNLLEEITLQVIVRPFCKRLKKVKIVVKAVAKR